MSAENPHLGELLNAVQTLRSDGDRDVCCFMHWVPESDDHGSLDTVSAALLWGFLDPQTAYSR